MTIGEKIKYCRKHLKMTQRELAELTGIHPVSIRKYEIDKTVPQPEQLMKIAKALGVSYVSLQGVKKTGLELETWGDLYGTLMALIDSNILRLELDGAPSEDHYSLYFNPLLDDYLEFKTEDHKAIPFSKVNIKIKNEQMKKDLLRWGQVLATIRDQKPGEEGHLPQEVLEIWEEIERIELYLQMNRVHLDPDKPTLLREPECSNPSRKSKNSNK